MACAHPLLQLFQWVSARLGTSSFLRRELGGLESIVWQAFRELPVTTAS